ncbi:potassium uptake system protein [Clostridium putrefaciens]|uniref:Potassium uptake system protein n=1 Tax=Clostridium putrefaciens TaxID=99675 RepID=A0A381J8G3_9CLOT|nr:TrkA family potassium uptake protein [Clostridium putrefaciens]SUY46988.1 potassium uptake system protein [Clostridium putrefaciens]
MSNKQYVVIGLGRFGTSVAKTLYGMGHDVLAIDMNEDVVQEISDDVTHAIQMDATDEHALRTLGVRNFDVAVITIGSNIQASVMVTLLMKELGIKYIIAKGQSELHAKVLYKIGADRVVLPEKDMGMRVAHNLVSSNILDYIELSPDYSIIEVKCPKQWAGKTLSDLNVRANHGINIMAVRKKHEINISPMAEDIIDPTDILIVIGAEDDLSRLESTMSVD